MALHGPVVEEATFRRDALRARGKKTTTRDLIREACAAWWSLQDVIPPEWSFLDAIRWIVANLETDARAAAREDAAVAAYEAEKKAKARRA